MYSVQDELFSLCFPDPFLPRTGFQFLSTFTVALYSVGIGLSVIHYVDTQRDVNDIRKMYT